MIPQATTAPPMTTAPHISRTPMAPKSTRPSSPTATAPRPASRYMPM